MDQDRFDAIVKRAAGGGSRRAAIRLLAGGALTPVLAALAALAGGLLGRDAAAGESAVAACTPDGVRCGPDPDTGLVRRSCVTCCSRCISRQENGQRRCACCRAGRACRRDDQCCSGNCAGGVCGGGCTPTTCAAEGKDCGTIPDGCGDTLQCGECGDGEFCGGGGTPNVCACIPNGEVNPSGDRLVCCSSDCCRDELPEGQCRCAGGCG